MFDTTHDKAFEAFHFEVHRLPLRFRAQYLRNFRAIFGPDFFWAWIAYRLR